MPTPNVFSSRAGAAPRRLADFLRQHRDEIFGDWERAVRELRAARNLEHPALIDHLPTFLNEVCLYLEQLHAGEAASPPRSAPRLHAVERLELGFDLEDVVAEYAILRGSIVQLLARKGAVADHALELPPMHEAIDRAIGYSVARYTAARERTLRALDRISEAALDRADLLRLLDSLMVVVNETLESVDAVKILLREGELLVVRAAAGREARAESGASMKMGEGFEGGIAATRKPCSLTSTQGSAVEVGSVPPTPQTLALYGVPLFHHDEVIGVATMGSFTAHDFSDEDKLLFRTMASRATAVIVQTQLFERERQTQAKLIQQREQVEAERRRLEQILQQMPVGVVIAGSNGELSFVNDRLQQIFGSVPDGVAPAALLSKATTRADGSPYAPGARPIERAVSGETVKDEETLLTRDDGEMRSLLIQSAPLRTASGERSGGVATVLDVTERKHEEDELRAAVSFRDRIMGVLSHDLRNPLSVISTAAQLLLRDQEIGPTSARTVGRVASAAQRIERMIRDLLDYTRTRAGRGIPLAPHPADLLTLCRQFLDSMELVYPDRKLVLLAEGDCTGNWDADRLLQVISNLVSNALAYSSKPSPVTLRLRDEGAVVALEVHNQGPPIPDAMVPHLFEAFRRGGENAPEGLGLGLYIVEQLVEAHGGAIEVRSTEAEGTSFTIRLPR